MTLAANSSGLVAGSFTIPSNVPVGVKLVEFVGSGGSKGSAEFTGTNSLVTTVQRNVINQVMQYYDPIAQTFTPSADIQLTGIDLFLTAVGSSKVVVQIRGVDNGFPDRSVLAEASLAPANINVNNFSRFQFQQPPALLANTEYAIVVLCNDAVSSVAVAQLGQWDNSTMRWVTSQPYSIGVLLSSSNAATWTAHQDMDLTFRLVTPAFTQTNQTIDLGTQSVTNASDFMIMADSDSPTSGCSVNYLITLLDNSNQQFNVAAYQSISLTSRYTGRVKIQAVLNGTPTNSPLLYPEVQLAVGNLTESATYVTNQFAANGGTNLMVVVNAYTPGTSSILVEVFNGSTWSSVTFSSGTNTGDGWVDKTYIMTGYSATTARIRITLTGNVAARPMCQNLRVILT